jgi:MFS family permease
MLREYRRRAVLCLVLMSTQAFFYNAIYFSYALVLTRFYGVAPNRVGMLIVPFAIGNFLGPMVLGRFFDTIGRRPLIVTTYATSGVLLAITGALFVSGKLTPVTQTIAWSITFFFGSAAASSSYLSASELFPLDIRGKAIAIFYALGTALGGLVAPALFGALVETGARTAVFHGYLIGAAMMVFAAIVAFFFAERAERKPLEELVLSSGSVERRPG